MTKSVCINSPDKLVLYNPKHRLASDVVKAFSSGREAHLKLLALRNQNDLTPDIKKKLLEKKLGIYRAIAETMGLNFNKTSDALRDIADERSAHTSAATKDRINAQNQFGSIVKPAPLPPPTPEPVDHTFWWSYTQPFLAPRTNAVFADDGLHFWDGPFVEEHNGEMHTSFGATAVFELAPHRLPSSPTGWFISSPHVELFGGISGYSPNWDLLQGDGIVECKLFLRQTIFQWAFTINGPEKVYVGEAMGYHPNWYFYRRNMGSSGYAYMPGFTPLPAVGFSQDRFHATETLYAEIEVRFDIYLNNAGAGLYCDPRVVLQTFQWPLIPA